MNTRVVVVLKHTCLLLSRHDYTNGCTCASLVLANLVIQ